jgi:DNA-binding NarL/FixJ family response regulator
MPNPKPPPSSGPPAFTPEETAHNLTPREQEILLAISRGLSNREVASMLHLSMATVRTHLEHIYAKLDVTNRTEAVTEGYRKGIITLE